MRNLAVVRAEVQRLGLQPLQGVDPGELMLRLIEASERVVKELDCEMNTLLEQAGGSWVKAFTNRSKFTTSTGEVVEAGDHLKALVSWWNAERDQLVRWTNMAVKADLMERRFRLTERGAAVMTAYVLAMRNSPLLNLTAAQKEQWGDAMREVVGSVTDETIARMIMNNAV